VARTKKSGEKTMKKLLTILDVYLTAIIPYVLILTLSLLVIKAVGCTSYSWLVALSPMFLAGFIIGVTNFLTFILDKLGKEDEDDSHS